MQFQTQVYRTLFIKRVQKNQSKINFMYVAKSNSVEDTTSNYGFLLRLVNTFTFDSDVYYPRCYKVNDGKTFKNLVVSFCALCSKIICILQKIGSHLTGIYKNHVDLVLCIIGPDQKNVKLYVSHLQRDNKLSKLNQSISPVKITQDVNKKNIC